MVFKSSASSLYRTELDSLLKAHVCVAKYIIYFPLKLVIFSLTEHYLKNIVVKLFESIDDKFE